MRIKKIEIRKYRRPLKDAPGPARSRRAMREGVLLKLTDSAGHTGFGEAAPLPGYSPDGLDGTLSRLEGLCPGLAGADAGDRPDEVSGFVSRTVPPAFPAARFALETALFDAGARSAGLPLARWLNPGAAGRVPVNLLLGDTDDWPAAARRVAACGYPAVKIKVSGDTGTLVGLVSRIREDLGGRIRIRLDVNRGWTLQTATEVISRLAPFDLDYVEEPLRKFDAGAYRELRERTGVAVALDESLAGEPEPWALAGAGVCDLIVLKPSVRGGLRRTQTLADRARRSGVDAVITTTMEAEIGTAAALHLCAALHNGRPAGLDTLRFFESYDAALARVTNGAIDLPAGPGLGVTPADWRTP